MQYKNVEAKSEVNSVRKHNYKCMLYIYIYETLFEQNCNNLKIAAIGRNM